MTDLFAEVIALAEEGGLSDSTAGELYGVPKSTARTWLLKYQKVG
jgi:transposase